MAERCSALQAVPTPGRIVFAHRKTPLASRRAPQCSGHVSGGCGVGASGRSPSWGHGQGGRATSAGAGILPLSPGVPPGRGNVARASEAGK
jgi:hypothetical protein